MTESSRLDRIELLLDHSAAQQAQNTDMIAAMGRQQEMMARQQVEANQQLRDSINDVAVMVSNLAWQNQETDRHFNAWRAEAQENRQHNDQNHRAFTESFQAQMAEIARISQRSNA